MSALNIKRAEQLAKNIVLAQGNIFIKELLREKKITIGATKADFERNMQTAIADGKLNLDDLRRWLADVEGWGHQHVYLYKVPEDVAGKTIWSSRARLKRKIEGAKLGKFWEADSSLAFPDKRELTGIYYQKELRGNGEQGGSLRFEWHTGLTSWMREPDKDEENKVIESDRYWLKAYRERRDRAVMRFEIRPGQGLAAAFIQTPWSKKAHHDALDEIREKITPVLKLSDLTEYSSAKAIKALDRKAATQSKGEIKVRAVRTRLNDGRAYVEFAGPNGVYKSSNAVLEVRQAVNMASFSGNTGIYLCSVRRPKGASPKIKIELFGETRRIRIRAQLGAGAVWDLLGTLKGLG